jgi:micrococcal nuclease
MRSYKKDHKSILASFVMVCISLLINVLTGNPINIQNIGKEVLGARVGNVGICKPNSTYRVKVLKVIDGDTLEIAGGCNQKVRLLYVDTPETVKANTEVQCYGPEASAKTKKELKPGTSITITTDKAALDKYSRLLAIVHKNDNDQKDVTKSINYLLVQEGFAKAKFYKPNLTFKKELLEAQSNALSKSLGLWSQCKQ